MLEGKLTVKLGSIVTVAVMMFVCATSVSASAAERNDDEGFFDPFSLETLASASDNGSVDVFNVSSNTTQPQPLTRISIPVSAVPVRNVTEQDGTLRIPPLRIPVRPDLRTPFRPWGDC